MDTLQKEKKMKQGQVNRTHDENGDVTTETGRVKGIVMKFDM